MGQILHGSATTTEAIRRAIQNSEESLRTLSKRYGINQKTLAKWKRRSSLPSASTLCCRSMIVSTRFSRLPEIEGDKPIKKTFRSYPIGYFHIDIAEVQTAEGKLRLFVAIDRTSKFAYAELHQEADKMVAAQFLRNLIAVVPYAMHTVLTDNGIQFTNHARHKYAFHHIFDRVCDENGIEHRLTKINHPWTNDRWSG